MASSSEQPQIDWHITFEDREPYAADQNFEMHRRRGDALPPAAMAADSLLNPALYQADVALIDAIHAAVILGKPLLLSGESGCGKTEVANFVAYQFGLYEPTKLLEQQTYALRFDVKSTTSASDLFYFYDSVGRFGAVYEIRDEPNKMMLPPRETFVTLSVVGIAVSDAAPWRDVCEVQFSNYRRTREEPRRRVVLIDEIDKAPREVVNDLVTELERSEFRIAELNKTIKADKRCRPIMIITTNNERALPDAFLRRCVFHVIPFPEPGLLAHIVSARIPALHARSRLKRDALDLLETLRRVPLRKRPGIAEFLGFLTVLLAEGYLPDDSLRLGDRSWENIARCTLLNTSQDQKQFERPGDIGKLLKDRA